MLSAKKNAFLPQNKKSPKIKAYSIIQGPKGDLINCFHSDNLFEIFRTNTCEKPDMFQEQTKNGRDSHEDSQEAQVKYEPYPSSYFSRRSQIKREKHQPNDEEMVWVFEGEQHSMDIELQWRKAKCELRKRLLKKVSNKSTSKKMAPPLQSVDKQEADLMEQFHPAHKFCQIIRTSAAEEKDVFRSFRPKNSHEYLDYEISQTEAKYDAGPTKIHFQQTQARYQPCPSESVEKPPSPIHVKRKMKRLKDHRGPVWVFEDEIRAAKYKIEQEIALKELKARIAKRTKYNDNLRLYRHQKLLEKLGPEWFQELSPDQLRAADALKTSIYLDMLKGSVNHTQETIGRLGLVLRPNPKHLGISLVYCCGNPVQFLLIFYQISNPKRVSYSLNDKLLLSAVVHLTLRETLRELHIRIPSPPKKTKGGSTKKKDVLASNARSGNAKKKSPYLCSFMFEPTWGRHKEGYKDNHVQHPESPYFDYVDDLRKQIAENLPDQGGEDYPLRQRKRWKPMPSRRSNEAEGHNGFDNSLLQRELDEEMQVAQIEYNKLTKRRKTRRLLRPSIYRPCSQCFARNKTEDTNLETNTGAAKDKIDVSLKVHINITDQYDEKNEHVSTKYQYQVDIEESPKVDEEISEGLEDTGGKKERDVADVDNALSEGSCHCLDELQINKESSSGKKSDFFSLSSRDVVLKQNLVEVKLPPPLNCTCKEIVEKYVEEVVQKHKEHLDVCRKKEPTFIITDTKSEDGEKTVRVIGGVKAEETCTCLERFKRRVKLFEERRLKQEAQDALKSTKKCYVIGGVSLGGDGKPVYMLSGVAVERPCLKCAAIEEFHKREEERLANMPALPGGRQKYVISGVQQRPEGNVYIISGAIPIAECECMRVYRAFEKRHEDCMDLYNQYLQKMQRDVKEYMAEIGEEETRRHHQVEEEEEDKNDCECVSVGSPTPSDEGDEFDCPCEEEVGKGNKDGKEEEDTNIVITVEVGDTGNKSGGKPPLDFDGTEMKRFIVLKEFPCGYKDQMKILKHALKILAMDGYPLAQLPNVHKLPIFKLWMDMRCGRYWTIEDKEKYLRVSKFFLHHTSVCRKKIEYPHHRLTLSQGQRCTWRDAKFVKAYADAINEEFYRKAKQDLIAYGQEYFPTTCSYKFPTKTFRDCYFAYVPAKEEEVFVFKPWTAFDVRCLAQIRHFLRCRQTC